MTLAQIAARKPPAVRARGAILVDATTGQALWEREADARLPIASTTKIMTALVAFERAGLDTPIRVRQGFEEFPGESIAGLRAGEVLPLREMLYGLMLPSGNDAAAAIASGLAESPAAFVALMNQRAEALGLRNTRFANASGLDAPNHHGSPRDLASQARALLAVPTLAEVVATREHTARGRFVYRWENSNRLLFQRPDVTGVKTGTTDLSGQVLVASAQRGDRRAIAVVAASPDRWAESAALFDHFFGDWALVAPRLPPSPFHRGVPQPAVPAETVPAWQAALLWAEVRLPDGEGAPTVRFELAGRRLGAP